MSSPSSLNESTSRPLTQVPSISTSDSNALRRLADRDPALGYPLLLGVLEVALSRLQATRWRLQLGARYTFAPEARVRPFVGVALGASDLSATRAMIDDPASGGATRVELAKGVTVFEQRFETGVQFSPMDNFDIRLTAAASHLGGQKASDDPNLALLGVAPSHSTVGARWTYPAELGAVWHF